MTVPNDIFTPADPSVTTTAEVIGENGKYKTVEAAAAALIEKDRFIEQLKLENSGMRETVNQGTALEEIKQLLASQHRTPNMQQEPPVAEQRLEASVTTDELNRQIEQRLSEREAANRRNDNLATVQSKLISTLGANYADIINQRAAKLGLGKQFLLNLAAEQPQAFFKLMEVEATVARTTITPPTSDVRLPHSDANADHTSKFYNDLRIKMGSAKYFADHRLQNQYFEDAKRLGDAFFVS